MGIASAGYTHTYGHTHTHTHTTLVILTFSVLVFHHNVYGSNNCKILLENLFWCQVIHFGFTTSSQKLLSASHTSW